MKFLILNTDYPEFLSWLYAQKTGLEKEPYDQQMQVRNESLFGVADFYSSNLRKLGHDACDIHANNEFMQEVWAAEHGIPVKEPIAVEQRARKALQSAGDMAAKTRLRHLMLFLRPVLGKLGTKQTRFQEILVAQVRHYKPDILLNLAPDGISGRFLRQVKPHVRLLVGQIAAPLPKSENWDAYDLVLSSLPNLLEHFRSLGVPCELNRLAFEPKVLSTLERPSNNIPVSFVGSLSSAHQARVRLLEHLCANLEIKVWGTGFDSLWQDSPIRPCYMGKAWGIDMYHILRNSRITLNHHIDIAGPCANNLRLFEATGVGTLLITDWKINLREMFELGKEAVAYRTPQECVQLARYYLEHEDERQAIARAGQQRTLREHTYYHRVQELVEIVRRYLT